MNLIIILLALIGFTVASYVYYTYCKMKSGGRFKPYCDINSHIICSESVMSPYGKMFGMHNGIWGMLFYLAIITLNFYGQKSIILILSIIAVIISIRLAYILNFKLKKICINCYIIYAVNLGLLVLSVYLFYQ
jgi:uncharacterized membrane protein